MINLLSKAGYFIAVVFGIINTIHNYFQYPDIDKFISYSLLACAVFVISLIYDRLKKLEFKFDAVEDNLQDRFERRRR